MLTIVIPAAGNGQRFIDQGYKTPKPLIDVCGEPMIHRVLKNLSPQKTPTKYIVITREDYEISGEGSIKVFKLDHPTEGAACTVLEAEDQFEDGQLIIANCDQLVLGLDMDDFLEKMKGYDGGVMTFNSTNPHHSYVKTDIEGNITEVAEKIVISDQAVVGIYYYASARDFVKCAKQMIEKDVRTNNEFYITPVYHEYLLAGKKLTTYEISVEQKVMMGTPEELHILEDKVKKGKVSL